jgi:hypothetical protein
MMTTLKSLVRDQLAGTPNGTWLTVAQIVDLIPAAQSRSESVSRALRKLFEEGTVDRQVVPGAPRFKQWKFVSAAVVRPTRIATKGSAGKQSATSGAGRQSARSNTFQTAVEAVVTEFVTAQKSFSAHDVTNELRTAVNAGKAAIDKAETGIVHVSGAVVPKIEHDKVRALVHDLFDAGKMPSYDRANNGQFWTYAPAAQTPAPSGGDGSGSPPPPVDGSNYDGSSTL